MIFGQFWVYASLFPDGFSATTLAHPASSTSPWRRTEGRRAAALFDLSGNLTLLREDVGRHNAMDKLVATLLLTDCLRAPESVVLVSGRASFELVQKALMAGIPIMAAVSAPSSLGIDLARGFGMTLAGFPREGRFNIYVGE